METALLIIHTIVALLLIITVILQKGKGAEMGAAFGVGSSSTVFGPKGPTPFLAKVTVFLAIAFMLTSIGLTILIGKPRFTRAVEKAIPKVEKSKPQVKPVFPVVNSTDGKGK